MKLLIVEDELDIAQLISELLEEDCERIWTANDGLNALEIFTQNPQISCVLSDINMPQMNGIELCRKFKQGYPEIPVLLMTAEIANEANAWAAGALDVIFKPFTMEELRTSVMENLFMGQSVKNK